MTRIALLFLLASAPLAVAQTVPANGREAVEARREARVRATAQGQVLARAASGTRLVSLRERSGWREVSWEGRSAWIDSGDLRARAAEMAEISRDVRARAQRSTRATSRGDLRRGDAYVVLERVSGWVRLQVGRETGWVQEQATARIVSGSGSAGATTPATTRGPASAGSAGTSAGARQLLSQRSGFGRNARGGDPSLVYRVTSLGDRGSGTLREACESNRPYWIVFSRQGTIKLRSPIRIRSNKTLDGRGQRVVIEGGLRIEAARNVIITDLAITSPKDDAILITGRGGSSTSDFECRDIWLNHLELYASDDGLIDIRGGTNVTVSWCYFRNHAKCCLMWKDRGGRIVSGMRVTMHHNLFDKTTRRNPNFAGGKLDYVNNYVRGFYEYGLGSFDEAQVLSEANVYEARSGWISFSRDPNTGDYDFLISKLGMTLDWSGRKAGRIKSKSDEARNGAKLKTRKENEVFERSGYYSLRVDRADERLRQALINGAGPR